MDSRDDPRHDAEIHELFQLGPSLHPYETSSRQMSLSLVLGWAYSSHTQHVKVLSSSASSLWASAHAVPSAGCPFPRGCLASLAHSSRLSTTPHHFHKGRVFSVCQLLLMFSLPLRSPPVLCALQPSPEHFPLGCAHMACFKEGLPH